jgi:CheY-like chemotaxis protein
VALNDAAAAVRERQALLEREKQALREADRAKDEFIAMMSHELRNPLAALSSASRLLDLVEPGHDTAKNAREVIKRQTSHTARLIEDLLDISRIAMGKVHLAAEVFDLSEAAFALMDAWRSAGRFEHHRLTVDASPAWIRADRSRVEQIVSNLLDNALKFSPADSAVKVRIASEGSHGVLEVADEGPGLTPEMMESAFDLFVQGSQGLARKSGGMGIGLALVKRLTELQGGSVSASSEGEGHGALFRIRFPSVAAPAPVATLSIKTTPIARRQLLVVDDNEDMRTTLAALLALQGHRVAEAADGRSALELAAELAPSVAIVDIGLPEMDGYEVARQLRTNPATRDIGLIALTGYAQLEDKQKAFAAGFDAHLTKPVEPEALEAAIASAGLAARERKSLPTE